MSVSSQYRPSRRRLFSVLALGIPWLAAVAVLGAIEYVKMEGLSRGLVELWSAVSERSVAMVLEEDGDVPEIEIHETEALEVPSIMLAGETGEPVIYAFAGDAETLMEHAGRSAAVNIYRAGEHAFSVMDGSLLTQHPELARMQEEMRPAEWLALDKEARAQYERINEQVASAIEASRHSARRVRDVPGAADFLRKYEQRQPRSQSFEVSMKLEASPSPCAQPSTSARKTESCDE